MFCESKSRPQRGGAWDLTCRVESSLFLTLTALPYKKTMYYLGLCVCGENESTPIDLRSTRWKPEPTAGRRAAGSDPQR